MTGTVNAWVATAPGKSSSSAVRMASAARLLPAVPVLRSPWEANAPIASAKAAAGAGSAAAGRHDAPRIRQTASIAAGRRRRAARR